jgi:hypothetical protein
MRIINELGLHLLSTEACAVISAYCARGQRRRPHTRLLVRPAAESAYAGAVVGKRGLEILRAKVRPESLGYEHL